MSDCKFSRPSLSDQLDSWLDSTSGRARVPVARAPVQPASAFRMVLIIFSQFVSHRLYLNMRIMRYSALFVVIAIIATSLPEVNARNYPCDKYQYKSRRCNSMKGKSGYTNHYPSRAPTKDKYVKVQSFFEFVFGGFVRPFTGRMYDGIQRIYPENRKTPKVYFYELISNCVQDRK